MSIKTPDLIRARHVRACLKQSRALGPIVDELLEKAGVPIACLESGKAVLPTTYFAQFLSSVCSPGELSALAFRAAPEALEGYPAIHRQLAASDTLLQALESFRLGSTELSGLRFRIGQWENRTWMYARSSALSLELLGWSAYLLRPMIAITRAATTPNWWPRSIRLPSSHSTRLAALELPDGIRVEASDVVAIEIPGQVLAWRLYVAPDEGSHDRIEQELPSDLPGALRELLQTYMGKRPLKITEAANLADCSVRSLQRELRSENSSYSTLFQEARYLSSVPLLTGSNASITEVAYELGYSDPAHFTRAFQRFSGTSPSAFRRLANDAA